MQSSKHVPCATTKWAGLKTTGKKPARNNFFLLFLEQAPLTETAACTCVTSEDQRCLPCLFHILFGLFPFFDFILFLFPLSSFPEIFFFYASLWRRFSAGFSSAVSFGVRRSVSVYFLHFLKYRGGFQRIFIVYNDIKIYEQFCLTCR